jgi:predicted nucleic acid-binding protein
VAGLADTTILVDHLRGRAEATALLQREKLAGEPVFASVLTRLELLAGARPSEGQRIDQLMRSLIWIEVTVSIADRAGAFANRYGRSHQSIDAVDYVIAATRDDLDVPLWTLNVKHFPMFRGLRPPYAVTGL